MLHRGHQAKVNAVAALSFVPYYGSRLASTSDDRTVQVWQLRQSQEISV